MKPRECHTLASDRSKIFCLRVLCPFTVSPDCLKTHIARKKRQLVGAGSLQGLLEQVSV